MIEDGRRIYKTLNLSELVSIAQAFLMDLEVHPSGQDAIFIATRLLWICEEIGKRLGSP